LAKFAVMLKIGDQATRDAVRPVHREYLQKLMTDGKLFEAGPFTDGAGSLLIYEAADEAEARAILAGDPYSQTPGVIESADIREWVRVFPLGA